MTQHTIGTREEWDPAREKLIIREKEHTRLGDELAQERRDLAWVPADTEYRFDTEDGEKTLAELFDGVEKGEEEIFPDPMSETMAESWRTGPAKALERQNAALVAAEPAAA